MPITRIAKNDAPSELRAFDFGSDHPAMALWLEPVQGLLARLQTAMLQRQAHPARTLVLLPFAQLLPLAQRLWARAQPDGFSPRFETTQNWASAQGLHQRSEVDIRFDAALDYLTAQALLVRSGVDTPNGLVASLVDMAHQLAPSAAAAGPQGRETWAQQARIAVAQGLEHTALAWEARLAHMAVEWATVSSYPSDALFQADTVQDWDALVLVQGAAPDTLASGLATVWGTKLACLALAPAGEAPLQASAGADASLRQWHACQDAEDEAQRAAACALRHIEADRYPVALVSSDRALTRRIRAVLDSAGVSMRDENGWKLSTSHAGATLMAWLRALRWDALSDEVLDAVKTAPRFTAAGAALLDRLEATLRREGVRSWSRAAHAVRGQDALVALVADINHLRSPFYGHKLLGAWLRALQDLLLALELQGPLAADPVGAQALQALRLQPEDPADWEQLLQIAWWAQDRMDLAQWSQWVNQTLEGARYQPPYPQQEQVVILPLSQMLGRPFAAVVLAGCDEVRLSAAPEPPGRWTPQQRLALGLPTQESLRDQQRLAWSHALAVAAWDILWRTSDERGESLHSSALVQLLQWENPALLAPGADARKQRSVALAPTPPAAAVGQRLLPRQLSASAYDDLRTCPYRFFAQRQLGLQEMDELDTLVDKRDLGVWLHAVLADFHTTLAHQPESGRDQRRLRLDEASERVTAALQLPADEFLPFAAAWPALREGYLRWLEDHESLGLAFVAAETEHRVPHTVGEGADAWNLELFGRIDRTDRQAACDGTAALTWLLDYKTESRARTQQRVKEPLEETQLAFYGALLQDRAVRAAFVSLGESDGVKSMVHPDIDAARQALLEGIQTDLRRIAAGEPLRALGDGDACDFCAVRGLCRKDFVEPDPHGRPLPGAPCTPGESRVALGRPAGQTS